MVTTDLSTSLPMFITSRRISTVVQNMPRKVWILKLVLPKPKQNFTSSLVFHRQVKEQTADACASFKNAMYGAFANPSKDRKNKPEMSIGS